jgi:iron(III) transport system permease protein
VRLLQRSSLHGLFTVRLPLLHGALLGAGLLAAVLSFAELGATLLLLPPGAGSLTIRIYNYLHYGQSDVIAGLCLVLYVVALGLGVGFARLLTRGQDAAPGEAAPPARRTTAPPHR